MDWIGVDLEQGGELYTVRLQDQDQPARETPGHGPEDTGNQGRFQRQPDFSGTASAGAAGKKVFVTDWPAPSTGRFHIAVGSEGNDRTGMYWLSIIKDATN